MNSLLYRASRFFLFAFLPLAFAACSRDYGPYDVAPAPPVVQFSPQRMLALVNDVRRSGLYTNGESYPPVPAVYWNSRLEEAAFRHSDWMSATGSLSHSGAQGSNPGDRVLAAGYDWYACGENIAAGYYTEDEVLDAWLASPGHRANIMDPEFTEMGVAVSGDYWTQVFASPR